MDGTISPNRMVNVEYYIVRIYRRSKLPSAEPVGVVEIMNKKQRFRFDDFSELTGILRARMPLERRRKRKPTAQKPARTRLDKS